MVKLRKLRTALYAVESGQISAAARSLGTSQPAASRAIQSLEDEMGTSLFRRSPHGLVATEAGVVLTRRIKRALQHLQVAETALAGASGGTQLSMKASDHELHAAIAISQRRTISAAARDIGLSQPALSRSLRLLEKRLGCSLFHRTTECMRPTAAGELLCRRAKLAFSELRQGFEEVDAIKGTRGGSLNIAALPLTRARLVPSAIEALLRLYPDARVRVLDGTYGTLLTNLQDGDIDLIVGTIRVPPPTEDTISVELFQDDIIIVGRSQHPLVARGVLSLADCLACDWLLPFEEVPLRQQFEAILVSEGLGRPERFIEADSLAVVRALLVESNRLAVLSRHQVGHEIETGLLSRLQIHFENVRRPVGWTERTSHAPTPLMREFQAQLRMAAAPVNETDLTFRSCDSIC